MTMMVMTMNKIKTYINDDYCSVDCGGKLVDFYFGYEEEWCYKHKCMVEGSKKCDEQDCHDSEHVEWCFVAKVGNRKFIIPKTKLQKAMAYPEDADDITRCLLTGIVMVVKEIIK